MDWHALSIQVDLGVLVGKGQVFASEAKQSRKCWMLMPNPKPRPKLILVQHETYEIKQYKQYEI